MIACLGTEGQRILYTFDQTTIKTLNDVKEMLRKYFGKVSSKWSERVKFSERKQRSNETIKSFKYDIGDEDGTEKESLAIVWACEKWRPYLIGRTFTLETDHEPLKMIFSTKGIDRMSLRIARWAIRLMAFTFEVKYKRGSDNIIPDFCSRFPRTETVSQVNCEEGKDQEEIEEFANNLMEEDKDLTTRMNEKSKECEEIGEICQLVKNGWPSKKGISEAAKRYYPVREELTVNQGKLFREQRLVVPVSMRDEILRKAHECHLGIQKTKWRLRMAYWWPGMTAQAEEMIKNCHACIHASKTLKTGPSPGRESIPLPSMAWERVAIDIKGPMNDLSNSERFAIVLVDLKSKWPEVQFSPSTEATKIVEFLKRVFAREGYPQEILSDNGTQFCSREFTEFLRDCDIKHIRTPLYNPESNAVVERFNRTLGEQVEMAKLQKIPVRTYVQTFLHIYRSTPHSTTGHSPSLMLHGREMKTRLVVREEKRAEKKVRFDLEDEPFPVGTKVCIKHPRTGRVSRNLSVVRVLGSKTVILDNGQKWHVSKIAKDRSVVSEEDHEDEAMMDWWSWKKTKEKILEPEEPRVDCDGEEVEEEIREGAAEENEEVRREEVEVRRRTPRLRQERSTRDPNFIYY